MTAADLIRLRAATRKDAEAIARLTDMAGEGLPAFYWAGAAEGGEPALAVGIRRAAREEGNFSYRNATMAELGGRVAAVLLGYRQPDPYEAGDLDALPSVIRPLVELESLAPGSWYVNVLAVFEAFRGRGVASRLLLEAEAMAQESAAKALSLIVASENARACALYARHGYRALARRPLVDFPGAPHGGDWVLMVKEAGG